MKTALAAIASLFAVACGTAAETRTYRSALELDPTGAAHQSDRIWVHQDETEEGLEVNPKTHMREPYRRITRRLYSCYRPSEPGSPVCYEATLKDAP